MLINGLNNSENKNNNKTTILNDSNSSKIDTLIDKINSYMENQDKLIKAINDSTAAMKASTEWMNLSIKNQEEIIKYIKWVMKKDEKKKKKEGERKKMKLKNWIKKEKKMRIKNKITIN